MKSSQCHPPVTQATPRTSVASQLSWNGPVLPRLEGGRWKTRGCTGIGQTKCSIRSSRTLTREPLPEEQRLGNSDIVLRLVKSLECLKHDLEIIIN